MAKPDGTYRDALDAAHARIAQLEATVRAAGRVEASNAKAATLAALHRERARVLAEAAEPRIFRSLATAFWIPLGVASVAFAVEHDWALALAAPVVAAVVTFVTRAVMRSNAEAAARQLQLVEAKITEIETQMRDEAP